MPLFIAFLIQFIDIMRSMLLFLLIFWIIMRWVTQAPSPIGVMLNNIIEPLLKPFRFLRIGIFDLAPIALYLCINMGGRNLSLWLQGFLS